MSRKFGCNLKNARLNKGFSQQALAKMIPVEEAGTISKWENGNNEPDLDIQEKLSNILEVSLDDLVKGDILLDTKLIEKIKSIPQIKMNTLLYNIDLPKCEIDISVNSELYYEYYENDEEAVFMQHLLDFGGAYNLEFALDYKTTTEIYERIENLYRAAWDDGDGLYEAGINLLRLLLIRDIAEQRKGNNPPSNGTTILLLKDLIEHDMFYCGYQEIVSFYKALMVMYGLYYTPWDYNIENEHRPSEFKKEVKNFAISGYEEMYVRADKASNPYAKKFLESFNNKMIRKARENLKDITAFEYWNKGMELSPESQEWADYIEEVSAIFDEIEDELMGL